MDTIESPELHRKHRPRAFKQVIGQPEAVSTLQSFVQAQRVPHAMLFTGASGCGKTTLARIVGIKLECGKADLVEINAADTRGIDTIREIGTRVRNFPLSGKCRIWIIDEAHKLSNDAQNALLKILEELPNHSYIFLCTTDSAKLIRTIITRCTEIRVRELGDQDMRDLLANISARESFKLDDEVRDKIIECSAGSARLALVLLNKILGIEDAAAQLDSVLKNASQQESIQLARCLFQPGAQWHDCAKILQTINDEPESVRYLILGYSRSILLKGGPMGPRAASIIEIFQFHCYESKHAGLALMCYRAIEANRAKR